MDDNSDIVKEIRSLGETLKGIFSSGGNSSIATKAATSSAAVPTNIVGVMEGLGKQFLGLGQSIIPVVSGLNSFANSTQAASRAIAASGIPGGAKIAEFLKSTQGEMQEASKIGIGGGGPAQLNAAAAKAGLTVDGFMQTMKNSEGTLAGFGRTAIVARDQFAETAQLALESESGQTLIARNMGTEELTKYTAIMGMNSKANLSDLAERKKLAFAASNLAMQIDETSRITGMSRESIADEMGTRLKSKDSQLAMMLMTDEQQKQYKVTEGQLGEMGKSIQNAATNFAAGGKWSEDTITTFQAMGPAGDEFVRAVQQQQGATTDAEKAAAHAAVEKAKQDVLAYQGSKEAVEIARNSNSKMAQKLGEMIVDTAAARNQTHAAVQDLKTDATKAAAATKAEVQAGQKGLSREGEPIAGAAIMTEVNKGVEGARKVAVAAALSFDDLNNKAGKTPALINAVTESFKLLGDSTKTIAQNKVQYDKILSDLGNLVGGAATSKEAKPEISTIEPIKRKNGSFGATGSFIEDFGKETPALLHGKEAVITEDQLNKLLGSVAKPTESIDISSKIENIAEQLKSQMPVFDEKIPSMEKNNDSKSIIDEITSMVGSFDISKIMPDFNLITEDLTKSFESLDLTKSFKSLDLNIPKDEETESKKQLANSNMIKMPDLKLEAKPDSKPTPAEPIVESTSPPPTVPIENASSVTIKDLHDDLIQLNMNIMKMVSHTENISDSSKKTAGYASKSTGSRI